jgi:hypothetical protein
MSDGEAPRVFVTYAHDSQAHKDQVRRFAEFLRAHIGLDVYLDQWDDHRRRDWSAWAIKHLTESDFILVIGSPQYKRRADGTAAPDEGRGSQFEAAMLRDHLTRDLRRETERILPVVLPGWSAADLPTFLNAYSTTRFHVDEFTEAGVSGLVAAITGEGRHPMPARGQWRGGVPATNPNVLVTGGLAWLDHSSNVRAGGARINDRYYEDSIVQRPASISADARGFVELDLARGYRRLTAVVGVLDDATEAFQVGHFQVYLDGTLRAEKSAARGKPGTVDVDVSGARKLRLEMYRPSTTASPIAGPRTGTESTRLSELAWGNPTLR